MERQHLAQKAGESEYISLYRDLQPGQNAYWNSFGDPPSLTFRADFELFACLFCKPPDKPTEKRSAIKELIEHEGPLTIQQIKETTGMLVKEITPALQI